MYRNKKDVDKHVEKLLSKLSPKDFNARAYTVARLYFEVGDYGSCQKYLEQYLTYKANNAAAHKLLGLTFRKLGLKDKALEELKISLDLDPGQTNIILDICELLADEDVIIEAGRARYWCEKAELAFPKHPITFKLRERLLAVANPNPEAIVNLLTSELAARPKDAVLHVRLLKHYLSTNKMKEAFDHSCNVEFENAQFLNNIIWYETLSEVLKCNADKIIDWLYQLLLLTVKERLCTLSETEVPQGSSMSLIESKEFLQEYDQAIVSVAKAGPMSGYAEFHSHLLRHHRGQFAFLAATLLLKRAKKEKLNWYDATKYSSLLLLTAWQTSPIDPHPTWLTGAPEKQKTAVFRWYREASYRCSQSGHMILGNNQEKGHLFLDQISQFCSSNNWKDKLFENIYVSKDERAKAESYITSNSFQAPSSKLPQKLEVQAFDDEAQKLYPNSLHHFVWILSNYSKLSDFKCTIFDMLSPSITSCGPESLSKLDILAFLYSATLSAKKQKEKRNYIAADVPTLIPANISDLLCSLPQIKWWDCAYKFTQNELGSEYTDIRSTLSRGIEVVRCVDNHGLDPELLCILGGIFSSLSKQTTIDDKSMLESRAYLYYASAVPLLEKLKSKSMVKLPSKRLFAYSHNELDNKQLNTLLHESKLYIALKNYNDDEYVKAIEYLTDLKSPESYFYLGASYQKIANEEKLIKNNDRNSKFVTLLGKSKYYAYKALEGIKKIESYKCLPLFSNIQDLIEDVESSLGIVDSNISFSVLNDGDTKFSSDENVSEIDSAPLRHHSLSSTPKVSKNQINLNSTNYRTALDSQVFNNSHVDQQNLKVIEEQIKSLQKRDATIEDFKDQTRNWFDENRRLGNQIINTIHSNIEQTTEQFKLLKLSVEEVKDQVSECRKECKDVADLKKQIADLKREVNKLKKSEQTIDESDLYNLNDDYRSNDNPTFPTQIPFPPPPVIPPFAQRLVPPFPVPPNPYQLYGQNFCNLYNQFSQLTQNTAVPVSSAMFNPNQGQPTYPGIYPASDQMYLEMANLVQPGIPQAPVVVPNLPSIPVVSIGPTTIVASTSSAVASKIITPTSNAKPVARSLPVNVVITSSDPLPSCTTTPAPILSVTIPQKHIKGSPHNYQIQMPSTTEAKSVVPPIFNLSGTKEATQSSTLTENLSLWNKPVMSENFFTSEVSKSVIDGPYKSSSPNTSLNKSRTLSEKSNTSVENYDPCPDFKPIIPLPAEVKVTTGEENETSIFSARAKLFRFVDKQWKERGIGEMKLLKHNVTGKVRVLMRREQVHKICANHIIVPEMEIKPMKNEAKAYFWVANDFAEESLILEKFCIRFKTADTAKEFFDAFEKARSESSSDVKTSNEDIKEKGELITSTEDKSDSPISKPTIGGFTFSSTPSFKTVIEAPKKEAVKDETPTSKVNVFSGITFKNATSSPFGNVFGTTSTSVMDSKDTKSSGKSSDNANTSDLVEEFEPTAEFKPVVPLPALVEQKTGEEDEIVLFEHRAKLLRFDGQAKEWKERGLGNIKLLKNKENNQKVRLLMRREQIMKVCCNHAITKDITFVKMPNMDKAVTWCAKDFSEGELMSETFCLRFKTVQTCNDFIEAVKQAQANMGEDIKAEKEEIVSKTNSSGFGNQFKPKPGSWYCTACYTNNLESFTKCACCEQPKPQSTPSSQPNAVQTKTQSSWGDQFKPKPGSWECKQCLVRNQAENVNCSACNSPGGQNLNPKSDGPKESAPKFNFGITQPAKPSQPAKSPAVSGWGDKFKPKEGSWECQQCFVRNEKDKEVCPACNSPRNPGATTTGTTATSAATTPKFSFGIPQKTVEPTAPVSLFNTNASQTFKFGIAKESTAKPFGDVVDANGSEAAINFSAKKTETDTAVQKPALLPTPTSNTFGSKDGGSFHFALKPKSPTKGKSPMKSPKSKGDESADEEYVSDDEGASIHFSPVIPMPDKIDVVTGEENEDELYGHRAKLFIFTNAEWKERGLGIIKILKHKISGNLRVLMRREQVHKICLNHILSPDVIYKPKDEKTWFFAANDFSEGELHLQQFCVRFQNKTIALEFKNEIDKAIESKFGPQKEKDDDVIFVSETEASEEDKQRAKELMLPDNFFTYSEKEPCKGCRGCEEDIMETPRKPSKPDASSSFAQSTTNSVYGTPLDRTIDTTTFGTPLTSIFKESDKSEKDTFANRLQASTKSSILAPPKLNTSSNEDTSTPKSTSYFKFQSKPIFGSIEQNKSLFGTADQSKSVVGSTEQNKSVLGTADQNKPIFGSTEQNKSVFGTADQNKPIFGSTEQNKSVFGTADQSKPIFGSTEQNKSVFGTADQNKPIFGSTEQNKSVFGNADQSKPIYGSTEQNKSVFGTADQNKPIFGSTEQNKSVFGNADQSKPIFGSTEQNKSVFGTADQSKPIFGSTEQNKSVFGTADQSKPIFGSTEQNKSVFGNADQSKPIFGSTEQNKSVFGNADQSKPIFGSTEQNKSVFGNADQSKPIFGSTEQNKSVFGTADQSKPIFGSTEQNKSVFGTADQNKPIFGSTEQNKSVFGNADQSKPILGSTEQNKSVFGSTVQNKSIFGATNQNNSIFGSTDQNKSVFGSSDQSKPIFGSTEQNKSIFGSADQNKPIFGSTVQNKPIFGSTEPNKSVFGNNEPEVKSIFSTDNQKPVNYFSNPTQGSLFGPTAQVEGKPSDVLGQTNTQDTKAPNDDSEISVVNKMLVADSLSFADLSKTTELGIQNKPNDFKWEGAGLQLFSSARDQSTDNDKTGDDEYDPHYEPIVPLPDKIIVTTGEEDEEKIFGERCKLYRFDEKSREWKERGVGEMKILYHPHRQTYRLLLRREQVHKAVLNMLIFMDLELLPMKNSNSAWTWAGNNYVDGNGSQETLAVRFKSVELANNFRDKVLQCVRKLQVAAADAIRKEKEEKENPFGNVAPLRLPKGMAESSRADVSQPETSQKENGEQSDGAKQVHFEAEEEYEHDYDEDYDGYYNEEEEEESAMYYACDGEVILEQEEIRNTVEEAHIQVLFDHDICSPKILITDNNTGEILADMLIHTDTVFQISGDSCSWSGCDYTSNIPANKTVTVNFPDSETTMDFYDSCETSKASTYESHDPES
ncbi:E3 SUMO-protein ligase RanBP2 [Pieris rapae]|uniref:E3 SUMO-protein ligase RanBP2 n=1 Tax=Pieris rapae TaxID=64459 RepID=UPI001E27CE82|nr:E3 SUMO-protein ligase RanBP2 [Pieris rapae]